MAAEQEQQLAQKEFDFDAGALCLDFANTVEWHDSDHPEDNFTGFGDLLCWGTAAGVLDQDGAERLYRYAAEEPEMGTAAYARAIRLREAIFRLFSALSKEEEIDTADLQILNEALQNSLVHLQIIAGEKGFGWDWREEDDDLDRVLWAVARSAGNLLTADRIDRVRQCADDRGCGYLFIDTSRNRSRRWCSMESCGNRAKARRHYHQKKSEES